MASTFNPAQHISRIAFLLLLFACSTSTNPWLVDGIVAGNDFDSSRLRYASSQPHTPLSFELLKLGNQIEAFLSLSRFRLISVGDSNNAKIHFIIANESFEDLVPIHEGQMRIRIPHERTQQIIQSLQEGHKVVILLDGFEETLDPHQFPSSFARFLGQKTLLQTLF